MSGPKPKGRSLLFPLGFVALALAAAGGYYAYVRSQNPPPNGHANEMETLRPYLAQVGAGLKMDPRYADADGDLVADTPADPAKLLAVGEIGFCSVPAGSDEQAKAEEAPWRPLMAALEKATGKKVTYRADLHTVEAQLAAVRDGTLHVTAFNTGAVPAAVNTAGFVPLFAPADAAGKYSYEMEILVPADSPVRSPADLRGKTVAFTALSSNSGAKAPLVILKEKFGLTPGADYKFAFSGTLGQSLKDVAAGRRDAACVANDLYARMVADGAVKPDQFRSVYKSEPFPPLCFGVPHTLPPAAREQVRKGFEATPLGDRFAKQGKVKFAPVNYKLDWACVRQVDDALSRMGSGK